MGRDNLSGRGYDLNVEELKKLEDLKEAERSFRAQKDAEMLEKLRKSNEELTEKLGENVSPAEVVRFQQMKDDEEKRKNELRRQLENEAN